MAFSYGLKKLGMSYFMDFLSGLWEKDKITEIVYEIRI